MSDEPSPWDGRQVERPDEKAQRIQEWEYRARQDVQQAAWDSHYDHAEGTYRSLTALLKGLPLNQGWAVLEVGCGEGRLLRQLAGMVELVVGSDFSPAMCHRAIEACRNHGNIVIDEEQNWAAWQGRFDMAYCHLVLQHNPPGEQVRMLWRMVQRLKADGWLRVQFLAGAESRPERMEWKVEPQWAVAAVAEAGCQVVGVDYPYMGAGWLWVTGRKILT